MKKKTLMMIAFFTLVSSFLFALPANSAVGIRGTFSLGEIIESDNFYTSWQPKPQIGFGFGIWGVMPVFSVFGVQPELNMTFNDGSGLYYCGSDTDGSINSDSSYSFKSIDIPILLKCAIIAKAPGSISIFTGPNFSFLLGEVNNELEREYTPYKSGKSTTESKENDYEVVNPFRIGFVIGTDAAVPLGSGSLVFDGRFLTDFKPLELEFDAVNVEIKRGCLRLSIGYQFGL